MKTIPIFHPAHPTGWLGQYFTLSVLSVCLLVSDTFPHAPTIPEEDEEKEIYLL